MQVTLIPHKNDRQFIWKVDIDPDMKKKTFYVKKSLIDPDLPEDEVFKVYLSEKNARIQPLVSDLTANAEDGTIKLRVRHPWRWNPYTSDSSAIRDKVIVRLGNLVKAINDGNVSYTKKAAARRSTEDVRVAPDEPFCLGTPVVLS